MRSKNLLPLFAVVLITLGARSSAAFAYSMAGGWASRHRPPSGISPPPACITTAPCPRSEPTTGRSSPEMLKLGADLGQPSDSVHH
jgi:hypothetical protein